MRLWPLVCEPRNRSDERNDARLPFRALLVTAAALLMTSGPALAAETICTGALDPAGSPYGNVVVPSGETCVISGVRVNGNVTVSGSLVVGGAPPNDTTIGGNVNTKDGCGTVAIICQVGTAPEPAVDGVGRVVVGGNVTIDHCEGMSIHCAVPAAPAADDGTLSGRFVLIGKNLKCSNNTSSCIFDGAVIGGNVELSGNGGFVSAAVSFVGGNLTANNNGDGANFSENAIGGDLKCNGNVGPVSGGPNTVAGTKQGQCAGL